MKLFYKNGSTICICIILALSGLFLKLKTTAGHTVRTEVRLPGTDFLCCLNGAQAEADAAGSRERRDAEGLSCLLGHELLDGALLSVYESHFSQLFAVCGSINSLYFSSHFELNFFFGNIATHFSN